MNDVAIRIEGLGKMYRIGGPQERYRTLRDSLADAVSAPFRRARSLLRGQAYGAAGLEETIWALRGVSFKVKHGEVVGIIGRNGAGKSTLLKILSRITEPTEGYADVYGHVGSLLEVGTGFHPELTGRENIYLNGAILGMSREEIDRKFDEIVAFAEVEKFIDTPVKHYSSGMGLRLGFAVAAYLEPEILVVDEVLAVGDAQFQKKCLGKITDVAGEGRTVLFVSHNMAAVQNLCERVIWLNDGQIAYEGETSAVISEYLSSSSNIQTAVSWPFAEAPGNDYVKIGSVRVSPVNNNEIAMSTPCEVVVEFWNLTPVNDLAITLNFFTFKDEPAFTTSSLILPSAKRLMEPQQKYRAVCQIPGNLLNSGGYRVRLLVVKDSSLVVYRHENILVFDVASVPRGSWYGRPIGGVQPLLDWRMEVIENEADARISI
jgi:lipopolysaccharide transport system ATP-binding protein